MSKLDDLAVVGKRVVALGSSEDAAGESVSDAQSATGCAMGVPEQHRDAAKTRSRSARKHILGAHVTENRVVLGGSIQQGALQSRQLSELAATLLFAEGGDTLLVDFSSDLLRYDSNFDPAPHGANPSREKAQQMVLGIDCLGDDE
jgi:hypothetical protein